MRLTKEQIPAKYSLCHLSDCECSQSCLHHLAYNQLVTCERYLPVINPSFCTKNGECQFYMSSTPILYATGFIKMQKKMCIEQYETFKSLLIDRYGHNIYFAYRRGGKKISPVDQQTIINAARQAGVIEEFKFDNYEEGYLWHK